MIRTNLLLTVIGMLACLAAQQFIAAIWAGNAVVAWYVASTLES